MGVPKLPMRMYKLLGQRVTDTPGLYVSEAPEVIAMNFYKTDQMAMRQLATEFAEKWARGCGYTEIHLIREIDGSFEIVAEKKL